jgi:hypothetical protein
LAASLVSASAFRSHLLSNVCVLFEEFGCVAGRAFERRAAGIVGPSRVCTRASPWVMLCHPLVGYEADHQQRDTLGRWLPRGLSGRLIWRMRLQRLRAACAAAAVFSEHRRTPPVNLCHGRTKLLLTKVKETLEPVL